jgi:hypothetical protein
MPDDEPERPVALEKPEQPAKESGFDAWFEYYYGMREAGYKITLRDIADKTDFSYGYIRQKKSEYDRKHGTAKT